MGVRIIEQVNQTGAIQPTADEAQRLMEIVLARHPFLKGVGDEAFTLQDFRLAFLAQSRFFRTKTTASSKYFYHWHERSAEMLGVEVHGGALLAAIIGAGDVAFQLRDNSGRLLEVALNEFHGAVCSNRWRQILNGAPLLEPVARPMPGMAPSDLPSFRAYLPT